MDHDDGTRTLDGAMRALERGQISRRDFLKMTAALGVALGAPGFLAACGGGETPQRAGPTGRVRFLSAENFWANWEPYQTPALSQWRLQRQVYDYLVDFPAGDLTQPEPMLATEWEQLDERTWEFRLREGVRFHDGQRFTAADVKASIERASGASGESVMAQFWVPARVQVVDDLTARIRTRTPFAPMLAQLGETQIVSAQWLEGNPQRLQREPNGTGPFRLVRDEPTRKTMEVNREYWREPARISDLIWEFIQDPQTRLNALVGGEAEAIDRVPPEHLSILEERDNLGLTSVTGIESVNLYVRPGRLRLWEQNINFRRAANWTVDREALVENFVKGNSAVATSFLPTETLFHEEQSPLYTFDPDRARAELEAAGVPDGGPQFELWVAEGFLPAAEQVVQVIADNMREVGLKPKVVTSDVAGMIDDIFSDNGSGLMYHISWASNGDPHRAAQVYASPFVWNYGDRRLDNLVQRGLTTVDEEQRRQAYSELQRYMWEQVPHVPLYNSDFSIGHTANLNDLRVLPMDFFTDFYPASLEA